ncbi:unnamed protein product [Aphanomyces euteiches]
MEVVKELLAHGASINRATNHGFTSLHLASSKGHLELVHELLAQGAAIEAAAVVGHTPLHEAAYHGKLNIVKELIVHGADVNAKTKDSNTALQLASWRGHWDIVQELMTHGLSVHASNNVKRRIVRFVKLSGLGWAHCIHLAANKGHVEVVQQLLALGVKVDVTDHGGGTPLHLASKSDNVDKVKENDPSVKTTKKTHKGPVASVNDQLEVLQLLLDAGAKRLLRNEEGKTARDLANNDVQAWFDNYQEIANKQLLKRISNIPTRPLQIDQTV